jgi:hypothetical protein
VSTTWPTGIQLRPVTAGLSADRFAGAMAHLVRAKPTEGLNPYRQVTLYLYEWLLHLGFVTDAQAEALLERLGVKLAAWSVVMAACRTGGREVPTFTVSVSDRRYATWSGAGQWYDLLERTTRDLSPTPCVTHIVCDCYALLLSKERALARLQGEAPDAEAEREHRAAAPAPAGGRG